jgi:hypothetical protein
MVTASTNDAWAGKGFEPLRFSYSAVMNEPVALFALYDCFFHQGICLVEGMPTSLEQTASSHFDLRERLFGNEWANWTASSPFWASGVMDRISLEHFEVDTRSKARKGHGVWQSDPLPLHTVRARPGRLSALSVFHIKIHFVWRFCMGAQGA